MNQRFSRQQFLGGLAAAFGGLILPADAFGVGTPILKLGVVSDVHLGGEGYSQEERGYRFPDAEKLNGEFHVYGYEWTPQAMSFFVDGMRYCTIPIDEKHDYSPKPLKGMSGHHDFHSVIFNNEVFTPGHGWMAKGAELKPEDLPIDYEIDWIRLYPDFPRSQAKPQRLLGFCLQVFTTQSLSPRR